MYWWRLLAILLVPLLLLGVTPTLANEAIARLELTPADIRAVALEDKVAWLKLTPAATTKLEALTRSHKGQWLIVTVDGIQALRSRIFAPVDSGILQIDAPAPELRLHLQRIQERSSEKQRKD